MSAELRASVNLHRCDRDTQGGGVAVYISICLLYDALVRIYASTSM